MQKLIIAALLGFILGQLASPASVSAQAIRRLYGTTTAGAPIALAADASGYLKVVIH